MHVCREALLYSQLATWTDEGATILYLHHPGHGVSLVAVTKEERPAASFPILTLPCFGSINYACSPLTRTNLMVLTEMGAGEVGVQMDIWCVVSVLATESHFSLLTL